jgi:hydroxypyruvate reductase
VFLVSGGASAMMELPLDPEITLADTIAFHRALVHSGASIIEINCVRKHFSAVKGGRLALTTRDIPWLTIALSDVPPGKLDTIASGPTLPDVSTVADCMEILDRYNLLPKFPQSIREFFASRAIPETVKADEISPQVWTLLSADDLAQAAARQAECLGFPTVIDNTCDDWEYGPAAEYLLQRIRELRRTSRRVCLLSVGEITVPALRGLDSPDWRAIGNGGRNQHFALQAATLLNTSDASLAILSAGSDGIDGHSDAAGAVVSLETLNARDQPPECLGHLRTAALAALDQFQSSSFLEPLGARIVTGPTGNNLRDLRILIAEN